MRRRPSSRLLVLDRTDRVLLFHFEFRRGALAGQGYWATPGGALEDGESFADAARRELFEETGIVVDRLGAHVAEREFVLMLPDGESVVAEERFYLVRTAGGSVSKDHWTEWEQEVMTDCRWWPVEDLSSTCSIVFPEDLVEMVASIGGIRVSRIDPVS